jgi:23S rRNA G2445 N2-methylase RlmL
MLFSADLPYGHRELTSAACQRLYPRLLKHVGRIARSGAYAVFATAAAPLFRISLAQNTTWKQLHIGSKLENPKKVEPKEREVWVGGMRVWVFLLQRV